MDEKPDYIIHSIPSIPAHHHILQYKELRLRALKTSPENFSTTYEDELQLSFEEWRSRIQSRDKVTIIAATRDPSHSSEETSEFNLQYKWVGITTVLGPKILQRFRLTLPRSVQGQGDCYFVVSVWVDPDHRKKGLARKMMKSGIDWIQADNVPGQPEAIEKYVLLLQVLDDNTEAIKFYSSIGFKIVEVDEDVEDRKVEGVGPEDRNLWMCMHPRDQQADLGP